MLVSSIFTVLLFLVVNFQVEISRLPHPVSSDVCVSPPDVTIRQLHDLLWSNFQQGSLCHGPGFPVNPVPCFCSPSPLLTHKPHLGTCEHLPAAAPHPSGLYERMMAVVSKGQTRPRVCATTALGFDVFISSLFSCFSASLRVSSAYLGFCLNLGFQCFLVAFWGFAFEFNLHQDFNKLISWIETCDSYMSTASPTLCVLSQRSNSNIPTIEMSQGLFRVVGVIEGQLSLTCTNIQTKDIQTK